MRFSVIIKARALWSVAILTGLVPSQATGEEIDKKKFLQHSMVIGAEKCIECHESEIEAWKGSHHYGNKNLHLDEKAAEISRAMGITTPAAIRTSALCVQCHFTVQKLGTAPAKVIDGVSCESCHGGAKDWLDIHNTGDRREADDTAAKREKRIAEATAAGMLKPDAVHAIAENCYSCHIVTDERLVNMGGHPVGSEDFELSSWLGGEVRHNFFDSKGKANEATSAERKRLLFVVGKALDMEYSLRGLARAKEKADYGKAMGRRCQKTREEIGKVIEALGADAPAELVSIQDAVSAPGLLKFFNVGPLEAAADAVEAQIAAFVEGHDGSKLGALDRLIPKEVVGDVYEP